MPYQLTGASLGGFPLWQASDDYSEEIRGKANSFYLPLGEEPGIGYVLMIFADLLDLFTQSGEFSQRVELFFATPDDQLQCPVFIEKAVAVSSSNPGQPDGMYMVTLRDSRFILANFSDVTAQFNVIRPTNRTTDSTGSDPKLYYNNTLFEGDQVYSWETLVETFWEFLPSIAGPCLGLPYEPESVPQNIQFIGQSAWSALHVVLDKLDMTTAYDPLNDLFEIIDRGEPQPGLGAIEADHPNLLDDAFPGSNPTLTIPATIRVYYHKQSYQFGTEIDTTDAFHSPNDCFNAYGFIDIPTGVPDAVPGSVKTLWDDLAALTDYTTGATPTVLNLAFLEANAAGRAATWLARQNVVTDRMRRVYQGIVGGLGPGSQVQAVQWYNFGDGLSGGWRTAVTRRPDNDTRTPLEHTNPGWSPSGLMVSSPEKWGGGGATGFLDYAQEPLTLPDLARHSFPVWPRTLQLVKITSTTKDDQGAYPGFVVRANPAGNYTVGNTSQYFPVEVCRVVTPNGESLSNNKTYVAKLNGRKVSSDGQVYAVYVVAPPGSNPVLGRVKDSTGIQNNKGGTVNVFSVPQGGSQGNETQAKNADGSNKTITAWNKFHGFIPQNAWVFCEDDGDGYYISDTIQGDHLLARIPPNASPGTTSVFQPPQQITVEIQPSDQAVTFPSTPIQVTAFVRFAPVFQSELVVINWTGSIFTIVYGQYDGGILGESGSTDIAKGGIGTDFLVALTNQNGDQSFFPSYSLNGKVNCTLGAIPAHKLVWITRNSNGLYAISREC